jgi:hypothetical protein
MIITKVFTFKNAIYRGSTKVLDVFDDNQKKTGSIQRFYRNKLQIISDFIFRNNFIINVNARDICNELVCEIIEIVSKETLLRSKWNGISHNIGNFMLFDKTKITTNPRWEVQTSEGNYKIEKNLGNKSVFIRDSDGTIMAEIIYDKPIPPQNITIYLHTQKWSSLEVAALYLLINIKY